MIIKHCVKFFIFVPGIANDSDIDKLFGSMHQSIMAKMKNSVRKDRKQFQSMVLITLLLVQTEIMAQKNGDSK